MRVTWLLPEFVESAIMHEMSLCEGVLQILEQQAQINRFTQVTTVRLEIGALACVEPEAMQFSFAAITAGTVADGARLEIIRISGQAWCMTCKQAVSVTQRFAVCPICGSDPLPPSGGDQLRVKELEVV